MERDRNVQRFDRHWQPAVANPMTYGGGTALGSGSVSKADAFALGSSIFHAPVLLHETIGQGGMCLNLPVVAAK